MTLQSCDWYRTRRRFLLAIRVPLPISLTLNQMYHLRKSLGKRSRLNIGRTRSHPRLEVARSTGIRSSFLASVPQTASSGAQTAPPREPDHPHSAGPPRSKSACKGASGYLASTASGQHAEPATCYLAQRHCPDKSCKTSKTVGDDAALRRIVPGKSALIIRLP